MLYARLRPVQKLLLLQRHFQPVSTISTMAPLAPYAAQHAKLGGPGDARPTASQIIKDQDLVGKWAGKVVLVTGCSPGGIGVETARAMHLTGADVYITVRDPAKGATAAADIASDGGPGKVEPLAFELDSLASIKAGAADFLAKSNNKLNVLINNAGVMACPPGRTKDGFETQFGTNHVGHFYLFQLLKAALLASSSPAFASRVISLSSTGHRNGEIHFGDFEMDKVGYSPWGAYGQAKLANIYFATELERRYGSKGLHALSLHPGGIWTPLQRHLDPGAFELTPEIENYMKSTAQGAATTVWAATAKEWEGKGGRYLEDCQESEPQTGKGMLSTGYAPQAYNEEKEKKLWVESLKLVGMEDDQ